MRHTAMKFRYQFLQVLYFINDYLYHHRHHVVMFKNFKIQIQQPFCRLSEILNVSQWLPYWITTLERGCSIPESNEKFFPNFFHLQFCLKTSLFRNNYITEITLTLQNVDSTIRY